MNAFASRGVEGAGFGRMMKKPRLSKRPRTFIAAQSEVADAARDVENLTIAPAQP